MYAQKEEKNEDDRTYGNIATQSVFLPLAFPRETPDFRKQNQVRCVLQVTVHAGVLLSGVWEDGEEAQEQDTRRRSSCTQLSERERGQDTGRRWACPLSLVLRV